MKSSFIMAGLMLSFARAGAQADPAGAAPPAPFIKSLTARIVSAKPQLHGIEDRKEQVTLCLTGIYTQGEVLYYRLLLINHASVAFDPGLLRFCIRDRKMIRRHSFQEVDQQALLAYGNMEALGAGERRVWIVALPKEIPSGAQYLVIDLVERRGGRHLQLRVGSRKILRAKIVNDLQLQGY